MRRFRSFEILGVVLLLTRVAFATPPDGSATNHIGPIRWTRDSIGNFSVPDAGNIVLLGRIPDAAVIVVDPMTGEERRRLPGFIRTTSIACSPDGQMCVMGGAVAEGDTTPTTLVYDVKDGRLLWKKKEEKIRVLAMSARLDRVLVKLGDSPGSELRSLTTGETIREYGSIIEYAFMDEWHQRVYVSTGRWDGAFGNWTVELDASIGAEQRRWGLSTYGAMCRLAGSDTLLVVGRNQQRPMLTVVVGLNVTTNSRNPVLTCPQDVSIHCDCIQWLENSARWQLNLDGTTARLFGAYGLVDNSIVVRHFSRGQLGGSDCFINEPLMWHGQQLVAVPHMVDDATGTFYYLPNGSRDFFYARAIGPTLSATDSNPVTTLSVGVIGSILYVDQSQTGSGESIISIVDMSGRVVKRMVAVANGRPISVSVADLPAGNYLCSLELGTVTATGKFSIVR